MILRNTHIHVHGSFFKKITDFILLRRHLLFLEWIILDASRFHHHLTPVLYIKASSGPPHISHSSSGGQQRGGGKEVSEKA